MPLNPYAAPAADADRDDEVDPAAAQDDYAPIATLADVTAGPSPPPTWWLPSGGQADFGGLFSPDAQGGSASADGIAPSDAWWTKPPASPDDDPSLASDSMDNDDGVDDAPAANDGDADTAAGADAEAGLDPGALVEPLAPDAEEVAPAVSEPVADQGVASSNPPAPPAAFQPGDLAARSESNGDPGAVSVGKGDHGKVSYGTYQIKRNNVADFIAHEGSKWPELKGKAPGSPALKAAWQAVAAKDPVGFKAAQYAWVARTQYRPQLNGVLKDAGLNLADRSHALQDVAWSTADQHGPYTHIVSKAVRGVEAQGVTPSDPQFDRAVINAVYDERGRIGTNGKLVHFPRDPHQLSLRTRMVDERRRALDELDAEGPGQGSR